MTISFFIEVLFMKIKKYKEKYSKKAKKRKSFPEKLNDYSWIITVTILAFFISLLFSFVSELTIPNASSIVATFIIILFIGIVLFIILSIFQHNIDVCFCLTKE